MAALSFCSSSPPQILHKQSKSSFFPSDSSSFTQTVGESSAKPISVSRRFRVAVNLTAVSDESGNAKLPSSPEKKLRDNPQVFFRVPVASMLLVPNSSNELGFLTVSPLGSQFQRLGLVYRIKDLFLMEKLLIKVNKLLNLYQIPAIGDGGNGYGNAMNVKRTVKGYIKAGFAGIIMNDQVCCEDTKSERRVVSREEVVMHIKAAVDARRECGSDIFIVDQTDSREAISLEESLIRARAFTDAGADVLSVDSLVSREEIEIILQCLSSRS